MAWHPAEARKPVVLAGIAGVRICRSRPVMADPVVCRALLLALPDVARIETCACQEGREPLAADALPDFLHRDSALLCGRLDVRTTQSARHRRILALVGSSSLGRRFLRSLRDRGDRIPVHP